MWLEGGTYRMGLSQGDERPVVVPGNVEVRPGGTLDATFTSKHGTRVGGVLLLVGGGLALAGGWSE